MIVKGKCTSTACVQFYMVILTLLLGFWSLACVWSGIAPCPSPFWGLGCSLDATKECNRKCCYLWLTERGVKQKFRELSKDSKDSVSCPRPQRKPGTNLGIELNALLPQLPNYAFFFNQLINLELNR